MESPRSASRVLRRLVRWRGAPERPASTLCQRVPSECFALEIDIFMDGGLQPILHELQWGTFGKVNLS
jgi:hypothetical protein